MRGNDGAQIGIGDGQRASSCHARYGTHVRHGAQR